MAKVEAIMVRAIDVTGASSEHNHNEDVAKVMEDHLNQGWTFLQAFYCNPTTHWPGHIMLLFSR